jgi:uncharacterized protein with GYD domain
VKFMQRLRYSKEGLASTIEEGFVNRRAYLDEFAASVGASVEAAYWAFGEDDLIVIVDSPDAGATIASSLAVAVGGAGQVITTPLMTAEEMDDAAGQLPWYRPPGSDSA